MAILTSKQKMGAAALIMAFSVLLSRLMGLVRDKVISWQFGVGGEVDIYFAAFIVPDFLNYLLAGGYISITLIPLLCSLFEKDEDDAWKFFGTVLCWATIAIAALTLLAWIFAPALAETVAPGFDPAKRERLITFLRIVLPAQVFFLPGACLSAILYVRRQFAVPALMPLIYNGCILLFGVSLPWLGLADGMEGFCWGVLTGAAIGAFLLPLYATRAEGLRFVPGLLHPMLKRFLLLALPLMLGQSIVVLDEQFARIFGSLAGDGAVSLLNYARRIMMVPVGVVAQAAGVASFPFLAALIAKGQTAEFNSTVNTALRNSLIVVIPITIWMISVAGATMGFIFEGGNFSIQDTATTSPLLQLMLLAVPFWALQQVTGRAFYARQDTLTPAIVGTCASLLTIPLYLTLTPRFGPPGVALVTSLSIFIYAIALIAVARKRFGKATFIGLPGVAGRSLLLVIPGTLAAIALNHMIPHWWPHLRLLTSQFLILTLSGLLFACFYVLMAKFFAKDFLAVILSPLQRVSAKIKRVST